MKMATKLKLRANYLGLSGGLQKSRKGKDNSSGINETANQQLQPSQKKEKHRNIAS